MTRNVIEIIGEDNANDLQREFDEVITGEYSVDDVEELMSDYGLEMDYVFDLIGY